MKKLVGVLLLAAFLTYIGCHIVFINIPLSETYPAYSPVLSDNDIIVSKYAKKEAQLLAFLERHMLGNGGEILTNTNPSGEGKETLSESVGILMNYAVLRDRKDIFDRELEFLENRMMVNKRSHRFVRWKTAKNAVSCNAAVDDLRIVRALLDAYDTWGDRKYYNTAGFIQAGIYESQVKDGGLCEFFDWEAGLVRDSVPLCYLDFYTMDRMSPFNEEWLKVADRGLCIAKYGRVDQPSPFFYKYYDYKKMTYTADEELERKKGVCVTYTLITAIHLLEVNEDTGFLTEWLADEMSDKRLYGWYDPYSLKPAQNIESTAVYALASIYAGKTGEKALSMKLLDRMLEFMVTDKKSQYFGGFGNVKTGDFYSFDNLTALWALALADR